MGLGDLYFLQLGLARLVSASHAYCQVFQLLTRTVLELGIERHVDDLDRLAHFLCQAELGFVVPDLAVLPHDQVQLCLVQMLDQVLDVN